METVVLEQDVLGYPVRVTVLPCGEDLSVTICGGVRPHVGSVTVARNGEIVSKWTGEGHQDDVVGDKFAMELSQKTGETVSVACGIHYDGLDKENLRAILSVCEESLTRIKQVYLAKIHGTGPPRDGSDIPHDSETTDRASTWGGPVCYFNAL